MKRGEVYDLLELPLIERWLRRQGARVCGYRRDAEGCPLARYLREETGEEVYVNGISAVVADSYGYVTYDIALPTKLERFTRLVDEGPDDEVPALTALAYLRAVR